MTVDLTQRYYVMTYGTLMRGQYNYSCMKEAQGQFIEPVITTESKYEMVDVHNSFPAVLAGNGKILGELFAVPLNGIYNELDLLEGYPSMYDRIVVKCKGLTTGKEYSAIIYVLTSSSIAYMGNRLLTSKESTNISCINDCYKWEK